MFALRCGHRIAECYTTSLSYKKETRSIMQWCPSQVFRCFVLSACTFALCAAQTPPPAPADHPITVSERVGWVTSTTIGPPNLFAGLYTAGLETWRDKPEEYGPHWGGFAKRYGLRLTGTGTSNVLEASIGNLWGEDPRYRRAGTGSLTHRIAYATKSAFTARNRNGDIVPAYARYIAIPSSNFISNTWRPDSQATVSGAIIRTGLGFTGRIISNAFWEFWPDIKGQTLDKR
jgi:hypothetical protein